MAEKWYRNAERHSGDTDRVKLKHSKQNLCKCQYV